MFFSLGVSLLVCYVFSILRRCISSCYIIYCFYCRLDVCEYENIFLKFLNFDGVCIVFFIFSYLKVERQL